MPSIFSRFADIISSNINSMLDKAENPSKMVKLIIAEMEDTLAELKAACAQAMAAQTKGSRRLLEAEERRELWLKRAEAAAAKDLDELAKEALIEKRNAENIAEELRQQENDLAAVVEKYRTEISQLESKLLQAHEKEQVMAHRENRARTSIKTSGQMKRYDITEHKIKLERLNTRLDKMEAEAELELGGRRVSSHSEEKEKAFAELDGTLDQELEEIKQRLKNA